MQYTINGNLAVLELDEDETFLSEEPLPNGTRVIRILLQGFTLELQRSYAHILEIYDHEGWKIEWHEQGEYATRAPTWKLLRTWYPDLFVKSIIKIQQEMRESYPPPPSREYV